MDEKEAISRLKQWINADAELAHDKADDIICEFLEDLGYKELVKTFKKIPKYYS